MGFLSTILNFRAKSAKRKTWDYAYQDNFMPNKDSESVSKLKDYISSDPDLAAAIRKFVDNALIETPKIVKTLNSKVADSTVESYNQQLKEVRWYKIMRNASYSLMWSGNAFIEIKARGKKLTEAYNIDPDTMGIKKNEFGEVVAYEQTINGSHKITFAPEEILHINLDNIEVGEWGMAFLKPLVETLLRKEIAESYLEMLIRDNKLAPLIVAKTVEQMQDDEKAIIKAGMDVAAKDPSKINLLNIDVQEAMELYKLYTTESFNDLLAYIQKQKEAIINLVQVPPIVAGTVDNSNRSNSEIQARYTFYNTIKAFNNIIKEELDSEFLPKIGWKGVEFKFGETDRRNETDILKNAKVLREDLHFTQDAVLEYLKQNGFKIPEVKKIFDEKMEEINKPQSNSSDFPSREPRSKSGIPKNEATRIEDKQMGVSSDAN